MDERPEHKRYNHVRGPDLHSCQQYSSSVTRDSMAGGRVCLTDARKGLFSALDMRGTHAQNYFVIIINRQFKNLNLRPAFFSGTAAAHNPQHGERTVQR